MRISVLARLLLACEAPMTTPPKTPPVVVARGPMEQKAVSLLEELAHAQWEHPKSVFAPPLAEAMPAETVRRIWEATIDAAGAFDSIESTKVEKKGDYDVVSVTTKFRRLRKVFRIAFDARSQVVGFFQGPVPSEIEQKTTELLAAAARGDFDGAHERLGPGIQPMLPGAKLEAAWKGLEKDFGAFGAIEATEAAPEKGQWTTRTIVHFGKTALVAVVSYDERNEITGFVLSPTWTAASYADPKNIEEKPVKVGILPGILTTPKRATGLLPAVVLVHGSGPSDEDETVGGTKVFKDLAQGLATQCIAVLRYVKRTKFAPAGVVTEKEEVMDGAHDAVEVLRAAPGIDPKRIYVVGHSQGAARAPRIAEGNPGLAGIVVMAGPNRTFQ